MGLGRDVTCTPALAWSTPSRSCWARGGARGGGRGAPTQLALTLREALLGLFPIGVLFSLLLRVLLRGLIVGGAADGGIPIQGLHWLLQGTTG